MCQVSEGNGNLASAPQKKTLLPHKVHVGGEGSGTVKTPLTVIKNAFRMHQTENGNGQGIIK